ncbi:MAG: amino acid ABC transporter permease [Anaerolineae bacterium]|nr:MAG: amino acid ABC transporter permease [Anaerolineae bacterium]
MGATTIEQPIAPPQRPGAVEWLHKNLFNRWYNTILTIVTVVALFLILRAALEWIFVSADWRPITRSPLLYLVGQYPRSELWRVGVSLWMVSLLFGLSWGVWRGLFRAFALALAVVLSAGVFLPPPEGSPALLFRLSWLLNPLLVFVGFFVANRLRLTGRHILIGWVTSSLLIPILLRGIDGSSFLPGVTTSLWGGLLVTLILAIGGLLLAFPIGILLALGRRSSLSVVHYTSTITIEVVRGVPLITILFLTSIIVALFLPPELRIDRLIRAMAGMTIFAAAYMAENIRGGLQAIPPGQVEAAKSIGLNRFQTTFLIELPQALRAVIPSMVGQFISLFKDTTLAVIVGITELLAIGRAIIQSDSEFIQLQAEVFVFIAVVFWVLSSVMSYSSRRLEERLGVGET